MCCQLSRINTKILSNESCSLDPKFFEQSIVYAPKSPEYSLDIDNFYSPNSPEPE